MKHKNIKFDYKCVKMLKYIFLFWENVMCYKRLKCKALFDRKCIFAFISNMGFKKITLVDVLGVN